MFNLDFLTDGWHFVCSAQQSYTFATNQHACIAMLTWCRCASPILFWPWPPYNLLRSLPPRLCLSWIFFVDPHWWISLCVQRPAKAIMPFQQIIVSPVRSTYGGYYGLVVVPPPRPPPPPPCPQTLHRSHDNLKNPYRIASIFYM